MSDFKGRHFRGEIVLWAVRWYCRYPISYRDLETMMTERGVTVDHSTIYRWVQHFAPEMERRLRWQWRWPRSRSWRIDETYIKVRGKWAQTARTCIYGYLEERNANDPVVAHLEDDSRGLSPLIYTHINPYGRFEVSLDRRIDFERKAA